MAYAMSTAILFYVCFIMQVLSDSNKTQVEIQVTKSTNTHLRCGENQYKSEEGLCCSLCPPGTKSKYRCGAGNDTQCEQCIQGQTYSTFLSNGHTRICKDCTICPARSTTKYECNVTHDTVCECEDGYYWDNRDSTCRHCEMCNIGFGAINPCSGDRNTRCRRCTDGTFSDGKNTKPCQQCKMCGLNELVLQPCDFNQDTICVGLPYSKSTPLFFVYKGPNMQQETTTEAATQHNASDSKHNIVPVYYALLGAVILALIIYVTVTQRRNCIKKKQANGTKDAEGEVPLTSQKHQSPHKSNQSIYTPQSLSGSAKYPDLASTQRRLVESMLHTETPPNWRTLATQLGYSEGRLSQFEALALQEGLAPVSYVLSDWSKHSHLANISTLARTLHCIGRDDVSHVLLPTTYTKDRQQGRTSRLSNQLPRIENVYQSTGAAYYSGKDKAEQRL